MRISWDIPMSQDKNLTLYTYVTNLVEIVGQFEMKIDFGLKIWGTNEISYLHFLRDGLLFFHKISGPKLEKFT